MAGKRDDSFHKACACNWALHTTWQKYLDWKMAWQQIAFDSFCWRLIISKTTESFCQNAEKNIGIGSNQAFCEKSVPSTISFQVWFKDSISNSQCLQWIEWATGIERARSFFQSFLLCPNLLTFAFGNRKANLYRSRAAYCRAYNFKVNITTEKKRARFFNSFIQQKS